MELSSSNFNTKGLDLNYNTKINISPEEKRVAQLFESLFWKQMIKEAKLYPELENSPFFSLLSDRLSQKLAESQSLGVDRFLFLQNKNTDKGL